MAIRFELINKDELPMNKTQVNYKKMVGMTLKFRDTIIDKIYNIKILEYITKKKDASFLIEYIYLENYPEYKEVITREINCIKLVKLYQLYNIIPSINDWERVDDYWVGKLKNNNNFKFSTNDKTTEYNILHSNWCHQDKYIMTQDLNGLGKWKIQMYMWIVHGMIVLQNFYKVFLNRGGIIMKKKELKTYEYELTNGDIVELRDGNWYVVIGDRLVGESNHISLDKYDGNLNHKNVYNYDIIHVYKGDNITDFYSTFHFSTLGTLVFKRE